MTQVKFKSVKKTDVEEHERLIKAGAKLIAIGNQVLIYGKKFEKGKS